MVDGDEEQKSYKPAFLTASAYAGGYLPPVKIPDPPTEYEKMYPTNHLLILSTRNPFRKLCVAIAYSKVSFHSLVACKFNYRRCSIKQEKHLCQSLFHIKLQASACNFIESDTQASVFY